jgi:hypothetical protein
MQADNAAGPVKTGADPETGLRHWEWNKDGFYLRLTQRLPDQTRAFFEARGFGRDTRELIATSCVFQTKAMNSGKETGQILTTSLPDWKVRSGDQTGKLLVREYWSNVWEKNNVPKAAQIAFNWSFLPSMIRYDANDYNWGMTSYGLAPGSRFDLQFSWQINGKQYYGQIKNVVCPQDVHRGPATP